MGIFFVYTGAYKLLYPGQAALALETVGVPQALATVLVSGAVIAELYVGALLLLGIDEACAVTVATGLLLVFTAYLCYLSVLAHPPACGCLGAMGIFKSSRHAALFGMLRNCIILWGLRLACGQNAAEGRTPETGLRVGEAARL